MLSTVSPGKTPAKAFPGLCYQVPTSKTAGNFWGTEVTGLAKNNEHGV